MPPGSEVTASVIFVFPTVRLMQFQQPWPQAWEYLCHMLRLTLRTGHVPGSLEHGKHCLRTGNLVTTCLWVAIKACPWDFQNTQRLLWKKSQPLTQWTHTWVYRCVDQGIMNKTLIAGYEHGHGTKPNIYHQLGKGTDRLWPLVDKWKDKMSEQLLKTRKPLWPLWNTRENVPRDKRKTFSKHPVLQGAASSLLQEHADAVPARTEATHFSASSIQQTQHSPR